MIRRSAVLGKDAAVALLRELLHEAEFGSLNCIALRVFHSDGSWEDLVLGGTKEEQAKAQALSSGVPDPDFPLMRMTISAPGSAAAMATGRAAELLAEAIQAASRSKPNVTIWIEVTQPEMPPFVAEAFDKLAGYGAAMVVTHVTPKGMLCSHPPGEQLPLQFLERLVRASGTGTVWHPLAQAPVRGIGV
ncbi:hypothetical protein QFZ42_002402 [Variovorax paradoxus]|uniref:hypothetical protein n=1 Tax=Variovorax paradoxus TaxID=34073 RepID=UPI0027948B8F|nr:hypothetical protein [Variovorax paradoxus]MDQ0570568.1 hypothetical protein [Variovorax paradoxus]